jgi:hypothetical protein
MSAPHKLSQNTRLTGAYGANLRYGAEMDIGYARVSTAK